MFAVVAFLFSPLHALFSFLAQTAGTLPVDAPEAVKQVMALAGFSGLLALIVNVFKYFKLLPDSKAGIATTLLNLVLTGVLLTAQEYLPAFDLAGWDKVVGDVASAGAILFGLFLQFGSSFIGHKIASKMRLPVIGASYEGGTVSGAKPKG